jgi:hypothetical protein
MNDSNPYVHHESVETEVLINEGEDIEEEK